MTAVRLDCRPPLAFLVLDRPDKLNALNEAMWRAIPPLVAEVAAAPGLRVLVLRGAGPAFAAGADIAELAQIAETPARRQAFADAVYEAQGALARLAKPTLARIHGACIGGGCGLALACDFRWCEPGARFGITPARLGLSYRLEETKRLVDLVGPARAKDLLFSARLIEAAEAAQWGLVDRVVPAEALDAETEAYALLLAEQAPGTQRATKRVVEKILDGAARDDAESTGLFLDAFEGADFREGQAAFMAKRRPRFGG